MMITMSLIIMAACIIYNLSQYYHVFGTDKVGQDVLYQAIKSVRTGLGYWYLDNVSHVAICNHDGIDGGILSRLDR